MHTLDRCTISLEDSFHKGPRQTFCQCLHSVGLEWASPYNDALPHPAMLHRGGRGESLSALAHIPTDSAEKRLKLEVAKGSWLRLCGHASAQLATAINFIWGQQKLTVIVCGSKVTWLMSVYHRQQSYCTLWALPMSLGKNAHWFSYVRSQTE